MQTKVGLNFACLMAAAVLTACVGTGPVAEAFLVAFALPNMFRRFFAEGAFNMAFIPMFSKRVERDDDGRLGGATRLRPP